MPTSEIVKPANKNELIRALSQMSWKYLESMEVVNSIDARKVRDRIDYLLRNGKKLNITIVERQ